MTDMTKQKSVMSTNTMVKIAIFASMAAILMIFSFPIPFAPPFMKIDFADVATLVSGFALGPVAGVITVLLKNIINILINGTTTAYVGELSNIIVNSTFVLVSSIYYNRNRTFKNAIIGLILGVIAMTIVATLSNYFIIFPLYAKAMFGGDVNGFVKIVEPINSLADSFINIMLFAVVPFNIVKGILNAGVTILIYKKISSIFRKF